MQFNDYQKRAAETADYVCKGTIDGLTYTVLGLASEAGELAGKLKRSYRGDTQFPDLGRSYEFAPMLAELGDALWYIAQSATEMGFTLSEVAQMNLDKLTSRAARGVIKGAGDDR